MQAKPPSLVSHPVSKIQGELSVPGDKSISHRALILGAIADGVTCVEHFLESDDCLATLHILRSMGVCIEQVSHQKIKVYGVGLHGLKKPRDILDCGNSGTSMRLLAGLLAGQAFDSVLTGDASLLKRPMARICTPLTQMGADIRVSDGGRAPLVIHGGKKLQAIDYKMPVASAQVKSSVLLAGLYAEGETRVREPQITRDHTERMLRAFVSQDKNSLNIKIPGDLSSAAFFMVAASLIPGSEIMLRDVGVNPTRTGVIQILQAMGADITLKNKRMSGEELVADILVRYANLKGIDVPKNMVSLSIDEFPILFIAAAMASGTTRVLGIEELRHKESDRIAVMAKGLKQLGIKLIETADSIIIEGGELQGGIVDSHADHRVAMAFLVAGAVARGGVCVLNAEAISTSFPKFVDYFNQIGGHVASGE
ncbi:MAG: 3-phosphoshikimate 1-carboxyvinyltransferase [Legionellaceae bacterium]|nr:3-phosphoshikimate 1-carboxyvinyltransferase [Legionellaceae bacterium]